MSRTATMAYMPAAAPAPAATCCPPPCPACGGLDCMCRPRFFAGQVLTDQDLNRLEQYVVKKNRLHNRYLQGWGVVCGLLASCDACKNIVNLSSGYALSPCGNDIIVCEPVQVDVCKLINKCRSTQRQYPDCLPANAGNDCADLVDTWLLSICYKERATRGITALRGSSSCGCGCNSGRNGSGGGCGCGCGGHGGKSNGSASSAPCTCKSRSTSPPPPPQCEPTLICEEYDFNVCRLPPRSGRTTQTTSRGPLIDAYRQCLSQALSVAATLRPPASPNFDNLQQWCCAVKSAIKSFLIDYPTSTCGLFEQVSAAVCPDPSSYKQNNDLAGYTTVVTAVVKSMTVIMAQAAMTCICSVLMPPCGSAISDDCVPLAEIQVRRGDCKILSICNFGSRKVAITWPAILYWLSPLNLGSVIGAALEQLCCEPVAETASYSFAGTGAAAEANQQPMSEFVQGWSGESKPISIHAAIVSAMGATATDNTPLVDPVEMASPGEALFVHQLLRPVLDGAIPSQITSLFEAMAGQSGGSESSGPSIADVNAMQASIAKLQKTVSAQQAAIKKLQRG